MRVKERMCRHAFNAMAAVCAVALAAGLVPAAGYAQDAGAGAAAVDPGYASDSIVVVFEEGYAAAEASSGIAALGTDEADEIAEPQGGTGRVVLVDVPEGETVEQAIWQAEQEEGVAYAQPNFVYGLPEDTGSGGSEAGAAAEAASALDDPDARLQYFLSSWEDGSGVDAYGAWETARADNTVTIAVLDTGIRVDHEDLQGNILTDYMRDIYASSEPGVITSDAVAYGDNVGHGTHVAGIAAASANNGAGGAGASYNANILPIKVFDNSASDPSCTTADLVRAYEYLFDLVAEGKVDDLHVVNMSLGGYGSPDATDLLLESKIEEAADTYDIMTVASGGNGDYWGNPITDLSYPADFDACVSVTALNRAGENVSWSDYNAAKDISAPGYGIYSTYNSSARSYTYLSGTSMSSPVVAGVASLLWAACPDLSVDQAKEAMYETANAIDPSSSNYHSPSETGSHGAVDAAAAVDYVHENFGESDRVSMSTCAIDAIADQLYTGEAVEPAGIVVRNGDYVLVEGIDYSVSYRSNVEVGTATVTLTGMGAYRGFATATFAIRYDLTTGVVVTDAQAYERTGAEITPEAKVVCGGRLLSEGTDYEVSYRDNVAVGTATVEVVGKGDYMGTLTGSFSIVPSKEDEAAISMAAVPGQVYTGFPIEPEPVVTSAAGAVLVRGVDYELTYEDNTDPGTAVVRATGAGAYAGTCQAEFVISAADMAAASIEALPAMTATGDPLTPAVQATLGSYVLTQGVDFEVTYANNVAAGYATAVIEGKGGFAGSVTKRFRVTRSDAVRFQDVADDAWYGAVVADAVSLDLMMGYDGDRAGAFGPDDQLTRGQVVVIMARAAGADVAGYSDAENATPFVDNEDGRYYTNAVNWAYENGLLYGNDPDRTTVSPERPVSRAELVVLMHRFAEFSGADVGGVGMAPLLAYADFRDVDDWAVASMAWATSKGIVTGVVRDGGAYLDAHGTATRAQMAKIITLTAREAFGV